jgi:hypothetical protein
MVANPQDGLERIGAQTSVGDLIKDKGQKHKVKVLTKKDLDAYVRNAVAKMQAQNAAKLSDVERDQIQRDAQARVDEVMARARDMEQKLREKERQRRELELKLQGGGMDDFDRQLLIGELQQRLADAEQLSDERMQDLMIVEDELKKLQDLYQAALKERDTHNAHNKSFVLRSTDLVEGVLGVDRSYYASKHQEADPVDENLGGTIEEFFHDFQVCAQVIETLSSDLERLRGISAGDGTSRPASGEHLLEEDLALLEQLKAGSLDAVDMAEPVAALVETTAGLQERVADLKQRLDQGNSSSESQVLKTITRLPDPDDEPREVLAALAAILRGLESQVLAAKERLDSFQANDRNRLNATVRNQMIRATELVQTVLELDNDAYGGRFQQEFAEVGAEEGEDAFFSDFVIAEEVVSTLRRDLGRLHSITVAAEASDGSRGLTGDLDAVAKLSKAADDAAAAPAADASEAPVINGEGPDASAAAIADDGLLGALAEAAMVAGLPVPRALFDRNGAVEDRVAVAEELLGRITERLS